MKRYSDEERPQPAQCYDCGLSYTDPGWVEALVSNAVWEEINPTHHPGAGLLCVTCIARRCAESGLYDVRIWITGGVLIAKEGKPELG